MPVITRQSGKTTTSDQGGLILDAMGWDAVNWARPLGWLQQELPGEWPGRRCLEIGAGGISGGLSLWMASLGARVFCTNLKMATREMHDLHEAYGLDSRITYGILDVLKWSQKDIYDVIAFKSILGDVASGGRLESAARAIQAMQAALRPGGVLVFLENLAGTAVHRVLRRLGRNWGLTWHYFTIDEMNRLLSPFAYHRYRSYGFFGCLSPEGLRRVVGRLDRNTDFIWPESWRYLIGGFAVKRAVGGDH